MKKYLLFGLLFTLVQPYSYAQDLMITKEGESLTVFDVEISSNAVFYKSDTLMSSPIQKINKDLILMIKRADGTKINLWEDVIENSQKTEIPIMSQPTSALHDNDASDRKYNEELISMCNSEPKISYKKDSDKKMKATGFMMQFYATEDSELSNKYLEVKYLAQGAEPKLGVVLYNRTDQTLFIDLANTFFIDNDSSEPYYIPTATSTTSGRSSGASVNLGSVANAVGVGGAVGALAGGVNVGGSSSKYSTNITYSQRIVSIPPRSKISLDLKYLHGMYLGRNFIKGRYDWLTYIRTDGEKSVGCAVDWNINNTPYKIGTHITYSFNESFNESYSLSAKFYLRRGITYRGYKTVTAMVVDFGTPVAPVFEWNSNVVTIWSMVEN